MPDFIRAVGLGLLYLPLMTINIFNTIYADTSPITPESPKAITYPNIDRGLNESLYPDEEITAKKIADIIEKSIRKEYSTGIALRDAHPKAHGCVRAEFKIAEALPKELAQGIFLPGKTYQAWIRFSNGSSNAQQADIKKDARGMAIKLLAVPGERLLNHDEMSTQDFIMINHPVFFVNDPARYMGIYAGYK